MPIELGPVTLEHLTAVHVDERPRLVRHAVPALAGDVVQDLGRASVDITVRGSFLGPDAAAQLTRLREAHRTAQPLDLLAEAVGQGYVAKVRVASLEVSQGVGEVDRLDYACLLVEHVEPPRAPALDPLAAVDTRLLDEAAGLVDDVQEAMTQVAELMSLVSVAGFGDPTTRLPGLVTTYEEAGGGRSDPAAGIRDVL